MENHEEFNLTHIVTNLEALLNECQRKLNVIKQMIEESEKEKQRKILIDMMRADEELGLYDQISAKDE